MMNNLTPYTFQYVKLYLEKHGLTFYIFFLTQTLRNCVLNKNVYFQGFVNRILICFFMSFGYSYIYDFVSLLKVFKYSNFI